MHDTTLAAEITQAAWSALNQWGWFGKHVEEEELEEAYSDVRTAVEAKLKERLG